MAKKKLYAYYEGDDFITIGTYEELQKLTGLKLDTLRFYATEAHRRRMAPDSPVLVCVGDV